jgi:hypothetical protein
MEPHDRVWRHILRHGALDAALSVVLHDLALGRGAVARFFSLPGMGFLGQTSFRSFIWQNLFLALGVGMTLAIPGRSISFWFSVIGLTAMAMISTLLDRKADRASSAQALCAAATGRSGATITDPGTT